jgi:hypothetical protein
MSEEHDSKPGTEAGPAGERRTNSNLREIFEEACRVTAPFFDPAQGWGGKSLTMYARQTLRETFSNLSQQEVAILFSSVQRFHNSSHSH